MDAYCFKCRKKIEIKKPSEVTLKNDKKATAGVCPVCNAKVYTFGKGNAIPKDILNHEHRY